MILKVVGIWCLFIVVAIANGTVRNSLISPRVGEQLGHILSSFTLSLLIFLICLALVKVLGITNLLQSLAIGGLWVLMTIGFEFPFGHYVIGHSWAHLLSDYNVFRGRLWVLVLITTAISPALSGKLRGLF